jgi:hypothetical protein
MQLLENEKSANLSKCVEKKKFNSKIKSIFRKNPKKSHCLPTEQVLMEDPVEQTNKKTKMRLNDDFYRSI